MTQQKKDLIKMIVWVSICISLMLGLWIYSHCTHQEEKEKQLNEATLVNPEDSVHFYEDGM